MAHLIARKKDGRVGEVVSSIAKDGQILRYQVLWLDTRKREFLMAIDARKPYPHEVLVHGFQETKSPIIR